MSQKRLRNCARKNTAYMHEKNNRFCFVYVVETFLFLRGMIMKMYIPSNRNGYWFFGVVQ